MNPSVQTTTTMALKDWAVTVEALGAGKQIILMRKGGIREETRHFEVQSDQFFLYPAYEHQKEELLKPDHRGEIAKTLEDWSPEQTTVPIKYYARLYEDVEVMDEEALHRLYPHHIWTNHFATERLKWKKKLPLHLLIVRVYKLNQPVEVKIRDEYTGCKSWLRLPEDVTRLPAQPVLSEAEFTAEVQKIKALVG
ncbi:DUF1802 family protein [Paenactinomyces guangxiensis]|uniref:DUF1802 family protein n=1 Tax=Paenactinomyces guangxiensis TaxID=1490290 RepID=A0A7W1WPC0_9BACL|nr:DUF1802 family protein [Paenactinomyces guangxiensis]MBA4493587.1 DUF1802 family protein [Paenactinomyces guangxiensis]MBH8590874.1 DUF1802 family protein [Paenactinomyces guangxiensis]